MLTLSTSSLKSASVCAAKNDFRTYLNGVCVQRFADDPMLYVVATDGHIMYVSRQAPEWTAEEQRGPWTIIIPTEAIAAALKGWNKRLPNIPLVAMPDGRYLLGDSTVFGDIGGRFPDWERATPTTTSGEVGQFNPELLARAFKALDSKSTYLAHNGNGPAVMTGSSDDAFVVIMPWVANTPRATFKSAPVAAEEPEQLAA